MRKITVKTARPLNLNGPLNSNRPLALRRSMALMLAIILLLTGLPWALVGCEPQPVYGSTMTDAEIDNIRQALETITDESAKREINAALNDGAEVQLTYTEDGQVKAYKIIREGVSKKHEDMTDAEKTQALQLLIDQDVVKNRIAVDGTYYALNQNLWMERGIIVYGDTKEINNKVSVTAGANYKNGQYRFWGYDINGGLYGNDDFPRDSDSGTPAHEKDWLTTEEIKESAVARGYIGEHGLSANSRYSTADKRKTAAAWLEEHPEWRSAGLDEAYILSHFYFNSVLSDGGLTNGQFTGVHLSKQSGTLYYQSFSVRGEIPTFLVTEGTVEQRVLIPDDTGGDIAEPETPEEPERPSDIDVTVELGLPNFTYVGHPTAITDRSQFSVDGEYWSPTKVYGEGLAKNSFRLPEGGGTIKKSSTVPTRAEGTFASPGTYPVRLTVTPSGGSGISDTKTIEVRDVPAIGHSLTGTQKQNRKQVLNLWVATHPERPLTALTVTITDPANGESVTLEHHVGTQAGVANALNNSENIKTRPIQGLESDELFTNCQLEFLTKYKEERTLRYTVSAEDSSGKTDEVAAEFTVKPDLAPAVKIALEPTYLRESGTNTAKITVSDMTTTDGDQLERTWNLESYDDLSFGAKQTIAFDKTGVGLFEVRLSVKDVWTEPTLEEYVTEDDRLTGEAMATSEVINVAPHVSLEPAETRTADLLFLTTNPAVLSQIKGQLTEVKTKLLEKGIDANLRAQQILPGQDSEAAAGSPWAKTMEVNGPFGYQGSWTTLYESNNYIADDRRLYKIDATWQGSEMSYYPESPYTITAWDGETGAVDWIYTFTSDVMTVPNSGPYFLQDDTETYLYFVSGGKTMVLDKATGSLLTILNFTLGSDNFVGNNKIYTVKSDGIYGVHTGTGVVSKVQTGIFGTGATRHGGQLQCILRAGETLYRGKMDLTTEKMTLQRLEWASQSSGTYSAEVFCADGSVLVRETKGTTVTFMLFDPNGNLVASRAKTADRMSAMAAKKADGNVEYVCYAVNTKSGDKYYTALSCINIRTGETASVSQYNVNGYPAEARLILAEQKGDEVYVAAGGYITWIANYGWGNGPTHGYPQRTRTAKFDMSGPTGQIVGNGTLEMDDMKEYGKRSDVYAVIHSGQNGQYQSPPSGNITALYRRAQTVEEATQRLIRKYIGNDNTADLAGAFVLTEHDLMTEFLADLVDQRLDYDGMDLSRYVRLTPGDAGEGEARATMTRPVTLRPDTTYYYEYDTTASGDIFTAEADLIRTATEDLTGLQYKVTETKRDTFDGKNNDRLQVTVSPAKTKVGTASTTYNFTVEEGKQAVLSFEYLVQKYSVSAYLADYVLIDGVRWKLPFHKSSTTATYSGHYTHPFLLGPGDHTIQLVTRAYTTTTSLLAIDDLTIEYVELGAPEATPENNQLARPNNSYAEDLGEGWIKVRGSFTTPGETVAYEGISGQVQTETAGAGGFTSTSTPATNTTNLNISVPGGETPVYTSVQTTSKPLTKSSKFYAVTWLVGGVTYSAYGSGKWGTNDDERITSYDLPHSHDFVLPNGWSNAAVQMARKGSYSNGYSSGTMGQVILATTPNPDDNTSNRRFFLQTAEDLSGGATTGAILTQNLKFSGQTELGFVSGSDANGTGGGEPASVGISNLRIYTIRNGVREYVAEEDIAEAAQLERWTITGGEAEILEEGAPVDTSDSLVYAKGQLVSLDIHYSDYEKDPSKASYYMYTHEPFNDGLHPESGKLLTEPITRFYVDGKYVLEHYQIDDTGDEAYDKKSNVATAVFYIGGAGDAPWIKAIATDPAAPEGGCDLSMKVAVDDNEKDPLDLRVEIYKEGIRIWDQRFEGLTANSSGVYPISETIPIRNAEPGRYEVVCTVSDETGTGIANRQFTVKEGGRIEGQVAHTAAWDGNRRSYNRNLFGTNASIYNEMTMTLEQYLNYEEPRPRGKNVFWAGEELILTANVGGSPTSVTAEAGGYTVRLTNTGQKNDKGESVYKGTLWSADMRNEWGKSPEEVEVTFKAYYGEGNVKEYTVEIILDSNVEYWILHRYQ